MINDLEIEKKKKTINIKEKKVGTDMGVILTPGFSFLGETATRDPCRHSPSLSLSHSV